MRYDGPIGPAGPQLPEVHEPPGYGTPHPPGGPKGEFTAETRHLIQAAEAWKDLATALRTVWTKASEGWGYPGIFGMQDTLYTAGRLHQDINRVLVNAAADGAAIVQGLSNGLIETANDISGTDGAQGANFRQLQKRAGE